jgi:hypothetical protein
MRRPGLKREVLTNSAGSSSRATPLRRTSQRSIASRVGAGSVRASFCALPLPNTQYAAWRPRRYLRRPGRPFRTSVNKLARTFAAQVEALKRHRSAGEQTIKVEHVTVNEGGQAVVGIVHPQGGERGWKNREPIS